MMKKARALRELRRLNARPVGGGSVSCVFCVVSLALWFTSFRVFLVCGFVGIEKNALISGGTRRAQTQINVEM